MHGDGRVCRCPPWSPWTESSLRRDANTTLLRDTSRISRALDARLTAAAPLGSHSTNETEAVCDMNTVRNETSEHVKPKVCDPEAPRDCRSSRPALPMCALLTSTFGDKRVQLTCRCSSVHRVSH